MSGGHSMSDTVQPDGVPVQMPAGPSAGAMLRAAREAAGLHIGALAVSLKVPVQKLEALEADDLAQLPDAVFARALAATVCRTLKIDPEPILRQLPQLQTMAVPATGIGETVRLDSGRGLRLSGSFSLPRPVLMISGALLLGAFVVLLLPSLRDSVSVPAAVDGEVTMVLPAPLPLPAPAMAPEIAVSSSEAVNAPVLAASAATPAAAAASAAAVSSATAESAAIAVFSARAPAWVQVLGGDGVVHLRKTMDAGETVRINGALPLSVVVGRADAINVLVRGKAFELTPVAKDNVARFQIK